MQHLYTTETNRLRTEKKSFNRNSFGCRVYKRLTGHSEQIKLIFKKNPVKIGSKSQQILCMGCATNRLTQKKKSRE